MTELRWALLALRALTMSSHTYNLKAKRQEQCSKSCNTYIHHLPHNCKISSYIINTRNKNIKNDKIFGMRIKQ